MPSQPCSAVLQPLAEHYVGPIWLEDWSACQLGARLLPRAGKEYLRNSLFGFGRRFRALLRPNLEREPWRSHFVGYLIVGTRRYFAGARFSRNGLLKLFLRPLHLHAAAPATLEVVP
jgi:hypothetical protein